MMRAFFLALGLLCAIPAQATTTYYVAINQSGASNTACDGLVPTDQGSGHCPYLDFTSTGYSTVRGKLQSASGVRMEVRAGTYPVYIGDFTTSAIVVQGTDTGPACANPVTLTNYNGEAVTLTGTDQSREVVRLTGSCTVVTGLAIVHAFNYNVEVRGGTYATITNNTIDYNTASDLVKGDGNAADVTFSSNVMSRWVSQCMDLAGVARWTISYNYCHGPQVANQPGIGCKFECVDVTIAFNVIEGANDGLAMGGVSSSHSGSYEALRLIADNNVFVNLQRYAADVYSCTDCKFRYNRVIGGVAGVRLGGIGAQGQSGCNSGAGNCDATSNFVATSNVYVAFRSSPNNSFWLVNSTDITGLAISGMTYCTLPGDTTDRYAIDSVVKTRAQWISGVGTDSDGVVINAPDLRCTGHLMRSRAKRRR